MSWIKRNQRQLAVAFLSVAVALAIHLRPDLRDVWLAIGAALGVIGLHLDRVTYGTKTSPPGMGPGAGDAGGDNGEKPKEES